RDRRPEHGGQHQRGKLRRDRIRLWRPFRQDPLDQPSRSAAAALRPGGTSGADPDPRRGVSGLSAGRPPRARAGLVFRRAAAVDRRRLVVDAARPRYSPIPHRARRSAMRRMNDTTAMVLASVGLVALLLSANAAQQLKIDFSDETVGAEPKSFLSV